MNKNESEKLQRKRKRAKNDAATAIRCLMQWAEQVSEHAIDATLHMALDEVLDCVEALEEKQAALGAHGNGISGARIEEKW